ncbi:MAG: class II fructose-bisphosphate aldolase [Candidatus Marinimicrobia bacterium]|jgi:fructose-bisphosphate aldolase class II|nr:class II fructose-bisphosphate aldolase [Candidatus Neomarinimicrobiota bacterium]MBT3496895.1 class II fructose-bisphosphate aldolase [Candidatus Neomarinimicrobiota bacterium]MBT3692026.1 class II fructose-bisphosphate aldolase [Candidatus Neomarinimicrobiota bacterium]MBT3732854.1 class II fructose-bisphosphate aldolase [Candidatus Neomarinimicrobiota bacterium]MBT4144726.1 class II fructose-bisphosphate aldolase [Candidatus Neomarinimicrobiota bacterium]
MTYSLKPGVVSGDDYKILLKAAKEGGYAIPAVNTVGTNSVNAVMEAAAKNKSDVIIQFSNSAGQFYAGKSLSDAFEAKVMGSISAAMHIHLLAEKYGICVVLHTDHANKGLIPWVEALISHSEVHFQKTGKPLYTSHMLDLSAEDIEFNLSESARLLKRMAPIGMSIEIELGVTGGEEDGVGSDDDIGADNPLLYTQPEDCLRAYELLSPIGHFSLAASFGNVHGVYKPGNVKLRPEILQASQALVEKSCGTEAKPLDLVFHGGSGSEKAKITEAISYGVFKMNIDTDTQFAFAKAVGEYVDANAKAFKHQIDPEDGTPYKKQYDPRNLLRAGEEGMVKRLDEAFADLGSIGKSLAQ